MLFRCQVADHYSVHNLNYGHTLVHCLKGVVKMYQNLVLRPRGPINGSALIQAHPLIPRVLRAKPRGFKARPQGFIYML